MALVLETDNTARGNGQLIELDKITILDWIQDLIPPRTDEEQRLLLEDLEDHGQQTPAVVTRIDSHKYVLIDGHGRYYALKKLNETSIWVVTRKFKNDQDIKDTMLRIQLGRRNLSENVRIRLIGEIWNRTKEKEAQSGQTDPTTRKEIADNCNTSESTVKRAGSYAKNISDIIKAVPSAQIVMDDPTTPRTIAKPLAQIAKENPQKTKEIVDLIASVKTNKAKKKVFEEAVGNIKSGQRDSKPQLKKIALSSRIIDLVTPIAKANNLPISTQIENLIEEYLEETGIE